SKCDTADKITLSLFSIISPLYNTHAPLSNPPTDPQAMIKRPSSLDLTAKPLPHRPIDPFADLPGTANPFVDPASIPSPTPPSPPPPLPPPASTNNDNSGNGDGYTMELRPLRPPSFNDSTPPTLRTAATPTHSILHNLAPLLAYILHALSAIAASMAAWSYVYMHGGDGKKKVPAGVAWWAVATFAEGHVLAMWEAGRAMKRDRMRRRRARGRGEERLLGVGVDVEGGAWEKDEAHGGRLRTCRMWGLVVGLLFGAGAVVTLLLE
ncbi:hypothetical protein B0J12DRAFT_767223, partial [Macrophomina phaseolina]